MGALDLRYFGDAGHLRDFEPSNLLTLLKRHGTYFQSRGVELPDGTGPVALEYEKLAGILLTPDTSTPESLIDALYFVRELATSDAMNALIDDPRVQRLNIDASDEHSPVDVALQVWLRDASLLQEKHAETRLEKPRSFQCFATDSSDIPMISDLSDETRSALEKSLDAWFIEYRRGDGARVLSYPRQDGVWFLVRHGDPFRREGSVRDREPSSVAFRPLKYDVVAFNHPLGEIRVNAGSDGETDLYRRKFGLYLFGDEAFFQNVSKYSLQPLLENEVDALGTKGVAGIKWIRLKEVQFYWGGSQGEMEIRRAKDVLAAYRERGRTLPRARIISATFSAKFAGCKGPRSIKITPPNKAQYLRDHDSEPVEPWLRAQGFALGRSEGNDDDLA